MCQELSLAIAAYIVQVKFYSHKFIMFNQKYEYDFIFQEFMSTESYDFFLAECLLNKAHGGRRKVRS